MLNTKRIIERAWKPAPFGRSVAVSSPRKGESSADGDLICSTASSALVRKGHLFVYTIDGERFMVPIEYLNTNIFRELLKISEEEFGLQHDGPIKLYCDAPCMQHIVSLLRSRISRDVERTLLTSIANKSCCIDVFPDQHARKYQQQISVCGF